MELIQGTQLVKRDKTHARADEVLQEVEIIAFYFSGHWCGPCREFTPTFAKVYKEMKEAGSKIEVIFVSSDKNMDTMYAYMNECHGDWYAVPFGSDVVTKLEKKYSIRGIPTLLVITKDGTIVREDGCDDIESEGANAYESWTSKDE